jgi:hypothetical protein
MTQQIGACLIAVAVAVALIAGLSWYGERPQCRRVSVVGYPIDTYAWNPPASEAATRCDE